MAEALMAVPKSSPEIAPTPRDPPDVSDWPKHMVDAYRYFTEETVVIDETSTTNGRNWGEGWLDCLEGFVGFQRRACFPDVGPSFPPAAGIRPPEIGIWMKNRRLWKDVEIVDKEGFGLQWWEWWTSLQPGSRTRNDEPAVEMDWSKLQKAGKNGFLLIMLSLVWWGKASNTDERWQRAVAEVSAVLHCMLVAPSDTVDKLPTHRPLSSSTAANAAGTLSSKRRREGKVTEGASKRRKRA